MMETATKRADDDMSWPEVGRLGLRYLKIPLALLILEMFYWFLTQPSNTLAVIQTFEAYLWHNLTELIFGPGASEFSTHQGWWTRVDLIHPNFPDGRIALYVGDECAGIHEMLFISTLVMLTDGVPQRLKLRGIAVLCSLVFVLNLMRLTLLYHFARSGCDLNPRGVWCANEMYEFHKMMFEYGFLLILVGMWTGWFYWVGGPKRVREAAESESEGWKISFRQQWKPIHIGLIVVATTLFILAASSWTADETQTAIAEMEDCDSLNEISARCGQAVRNYDDAISTAWSLGTLGMLSIAGASISIQRPEKGLESE